jgi:hypothetical protein
VSEEPPADEPTAGDEPTPAGLLTTGEVMERTGLSRQVLYHYTSIGLIEEAATTPAGHRLYPEHVVRHLAVIRALNETGYSLRDIRDVFFRRGRGAAGWAARSARPLTSDTRCAAGAAPGP